MSTVKIVRLVSGEDIIGYVEEDNDTVLLGSPMTVLFKRIPSSGKSIMMMSYHMKLLKKILLKYLEIRYCSS